MKKLKLYALLFWTMFKIGLFTFGGGYAMITMLEDQFVTRKKWLDNKEFMDIVAIAESTPGPVAVNSATYVGYRTAGVMGSVLCTLAVCMPSFVIIYLISLFFNAFIQLEYVAYAFEGIQACVIFLILAAGVKMIIKVRKSVFNIIIFTATFATMLTLSLLAVDFSSIYYVLISAAAGFIAYTTGYAAKHIKMRNNRDICAGECPDAAVQQSAEGNGDKPDGAPSCHIDKSDGAPAPSCEEGENSRSAASKTDCGGDGEESVGNASDGKGDEE